MATVLLSASGSRRLGLGQLRRLRLLPPVLVLVLSPPGRLAAQPTASQFVRVHRSYLVAVGRVTALDGNELVLGPHRVPVSRDLREQVLRQIFEVG